MTFVRNGEWDFAHTVIVKYLVNCHVVLEDFTLSSSLFYTKFENDPWDVHLLLTKQETSWIEGVYNHGIAIGAWLMDTGMSSHYDVMQ